jgi:carbon monoxide dehydrogenase subunit G
MAKIRREVAVEKAPAQVVAYLKDFSHAQQWDPGTLACSRLDDGPVREGSTWRNVSRFLGRQAELTYRLERALPDRLTFVGTNHAARSVDDLTFTATGTGTRITYTADIRLQGAARLADPLVRLALERMAGKVTAQMRQVINAL